MAGARIRVICGPTAAGKSSIALRLGLEYGATIISADSRQIYRGFDIGTAKPSVAEQRAVPHRGIDVAEPAERYSAAKWATAALGWIEQSRRDGLAPLVVGGTGLYIRALFEPLFEAPQLDHQKRERLARLLAPMSLDELRRWCARLDPEKARFGRVQLARAIETALLAGRKLSELQRASADTGAAGKASPVTATYLVVDPGAGLQDAIESRVDSMLDAGWMEEVRALDANVPEDASAWKASGYRAAREAVRGHIDLSEARSRIIIETRQYAKRQRTWFRHQLSGSPVTRVSPADPGCPAAIERWWKESS